VKRTLLPLGSSKFSAMRQLPRDDGVHTDPALGLHWSLQGFTAHVVWASLSPAVVSRWIRARGPELQVILLSGETLAFPFWSSHLVSSSGSPDTLPRDTI
jgi:hypothetical protein